MTTPTNDFDSDEQDYAVWGYPKGKPPLSNTQDEMI
jgi:hypothetical protein